MTLAPEWLQKVSDINPVKHIVEGVRVLFTGTTNATVVWGLVLTVALVALGIWYGTRTFRRESA